MKRKEKNIQIDTSVKMKRKRESYCKDEEKERKVDRYILV